MDEWRIFKKKLMRSRLKWTGHVERNGEETSAGSIFQRGGAATGDILVPILVFTLGTKSKIRWFKYHKSRESMECYTFTSFGIDIRLKGLILYTG